MGSLGNIALGGALAVAAVLALWLLASLIDERHAAARRRQTD